MKKSILVLILLLSTGIAFSQTTVTLQDQCNCEVLKGTDVSSPGAIVPSGADTGDIYVNTNTGTIYFWDGDTWELTSSDDQQLTGFTFNDATNTLTLTLENGGSVNVDLSSLSDSLTDTNTTITSFGIDGTNTNLVITDSDTNTYAVSLADIAALIDTDNQTLSEVLSEGNSAGTSITNVTDPTNAQDAATKNYVDTQITANAADGSETIVNGGTDISVSGSGTSGDPYVVNSTFTEVDGSVTNEINTRFEVSGANLEIEDSNGTLQVALADINIDQTASDVDLDTSVDSDGDGSSETTVEGAIQAMSPIVSKAARIFYPPSIAVDASTNGVGLTLNLYDQYVAQFGTPAVASLGAPAAIPTYGATDLYYYVTYADPAVFDNMSIDASGELTYDIIGQPSDYNALINVVFVVK